MPGTSKPTWVRIADPNNPYTSLSKSSQQCLTWNSTLGTATPAASTGSSRCVCRRRLGRDRGLGNHFLARYGQYGPALSSLDSGTSHASRRWRSWQATHSHIGGGHYSFSMPSGTDNSATEASLNKMFTTSWPLQLFVQLTAFWAHARNVLLQPTHVPGRSNDWADDLSRGRLARFSHRPESRVRFSPAGLALSGRGIQLCSIDAPWRPEHLAAASSSA